MEKIVTDQARIPEIVRREVVNCPKKAIEKNDVFRLGVSGGSLVKYLCETFNSVPESELLKWKIFFCDERYVPEDNEDSTLKAYKENYPVLEKQLFPIDYSLPLEKCAADYEQKILGEFGLAEGQIPEFDLLLLGMGDDGHTCSLFPGHKLLQEKNKLIAPIDDSPKHPPKRVTMTLPLINNAKQVVFVITGSSKADVAKIAFIDKDLPAGLVAPKILKGIFDLEAGRKL